MQQVSLPSQKYFHRFRRPDKTIFEIESTQIEYDALALKDATRPFNPDGVWVNSWRGYVLPLGTWCQETPTQKLMNYDGHTVPIRSEYIDSNGNLTVEGLAWYQKILPQL